MTPPALRATPTGRTIGRALMVANVAVLAGILFGQLTMTSFGAPINEGLFEPFAATLSAIPGMVRVSSILTDIGKLTVNYGMAFGVGFFLYLSRRDWKLPVFVVAVMVGLHGFQSVVTRIVDSSTPSGEYVIGTPGPYLSGGVLRVLVLAGLFAVLAGRSRVDAYRIAAVLAAVEAITRMALGRHWPFDILASIPLGYALLWSALEFHDAVLARHDDTVDDPTAENAGNELAAH